MDIKILSVPQRGGSIQYIAVTADDAEDIVCYGALIYARPALASLVVYPDGQRIWTFTGQRNPRGRAAILEHLQDLESAAAEIDAPCERLNSGGESEAEAHRREIGPEAWEHQKVRCEGTCGRTFHPMELDENWKCRDCRGA